MKYYTSDLHFGHENIIKYEGRPFKSLEDMETKLIEKWNDKITKRDDVYILGDFSFYSVPKTLEIASKLKGRKHLILGNHDSRKILKRNCVFDWIKDYEEIKDGGQRIILFHYPLTVWNAKEHESLQLFGHVHTYRNFKPQENQYHVGADKWNYTPVSLEEILEKERSRKNARKNF